LRDSLAPFRHRPCFWAKDNLVTHGTVSRLTVRKFGSASLMFAALLLAAVPLVNSQEDRKIETIDSTATGTSTQLGTIVNVKITIYQYSTDEDREVLVAAFKKPALMHPKPSELGS
jgi:hypothetical protein